MFGQGPLAESSYLTSLQVAEEKETFVIHVALVELMGRDGMVRGVMVRDVMVRDVLMRDVMVRGVMVKDVTVRDVIVRNVMVRDVMVSVTQVKHVKETMSRWSWVIVWIELMVNRSSR